MEVQLTAVPAMGDYNHPVCDPDGVTFGFAAAEYNVPLLPGASVKLLHLLFGSCGCKLWCTFRIDLPLQ